MTSELDARLLGDQYGYKVTNIFGEIHIKTKCEEWYFKPSKEKTRLMHQNTRMQKHGEYHEQWKRECSTKELFQYIHNHERDRYGIE